MSSSAQTELAAMRRIATTLDSLDQASRQRVLGWAYDRYAAPMPPGPGRGLALRPTATAEQEQHDAPAD